MLELNVPCVWVIALDIVIASPNSKVPPKASTVMGKVRVLPALVRVIVRLRLAKVCPLVPVTVIAELSVKDPYQADPPVKLNVIPVVLVEQSSAEIPPVIVSVPVSVVLLSITAVS